MNIHRCGGATIFILISLFVLSTANAYEGNNTFQPDIFPYPVSNRTFSIPLEPDKTVMIVPASMKSGIAGLSTTFEKRFGRALKIFSADEVKPEDIANFHLIILGNLSNNRYARDLYNRRQAFVDAYFPGKGGILIQPTTSIWNFARNVLVIGVSYDSDLQAGFDKFMELLPDGAQAIPALHLLKTDLAFPKPPGNVDNTLTKIRTDFTTIPSWSEIPLWGMCYYFSGDKKWAEYFREGCRALYERAQKSGKWVPDQWTTLYYELWRYFRVWRLIDDDPFFTAEDRRLVENLLWAYTRFLDSDENFPYYKPEKMTFGIRQNHASFHSLSLYYSHQYFKEKYGLSDLDVLAKKYEPTFAGQATSYRSNDDAGYGYMYYSPHQTLMYQFMRGEDSYLKGKLPILADLAVTVIDNRRDAASFGDFSSYSPRVKGSRRWLEIVYPSMAAWYFGDSQCQWFYNWLTKDAAFTIDNLYYGDYAVDIPATPPERFLGVHPVLLDEGALDWVASRVEKKTYIPLKDERYVDKLSMRRSFDPNEEYLLMDGTSIFAHGHEDGNTIIRLTWKDRIWLCDLDYIKNTPKYHNGVIVARNGIQEPPPPLTRMAASADFGDVGVTSTLSEDFNGADWERNIIWKKGLYFLFLDKIKAREDGDYRLESRWRTRGDTKLADNLLSIDQKGEQFFIMSADDSEKNLLYEPDDYRNNWNYPYGKKETCILYARKDIALSKGGSWTFSNLMHPADTETAPRFTLKKAGENLFMIEGKTSSELIGLDPAALAEKGIETDAGVFLLDARNLRLVNVTRFGFSGAYMNADCPLQMTINCATQTGSIAVLGSDSVVLSVKNIIISGTGAVNQPASSSITLNPGTYSLKFTGAIRMPVIQTRSFTQRSYDIHPVKKKPVFQDFGIETGEVFDIPDTVTAFCSDGPSVLCADMRGRIVRFEGQKRQDIFQLPPRRRITAIHAGDINRDRISEIIAGDTADTLWALTNTGKKLWKFGMKAFYGDNANATDITTVETDGVKEPPVYVATKGYKAYGLDAKGAMKWETLIRYHSLTKIGYLENGSDRYLAVGTIYSTPLNVLRPETGVPLWYTWEQVGDETKSVTDYCGIDLTDMVFLDSDGDGKREIVFGTRYNTVYALNAADGSTKWRSNVGGEVTKLATFENPSTGEPVLLAGTDAGDLFMLDRSGKRIGSASLSGSIIDIKAVAGQKGGSVTILTAAADGSVAIFDDRLQIKAFHSFGEKPLKGIVLGNITRESLMFFIVSNNAVSLNSFKLFQGKTSRFN